MFAESGSVNQGFQENSAMCFGNKYLGSCVDKYLAGRMAFSILLWLAACILRTFWSTVTKKPSIIMCQICRDNTL
jgi:hypothetical protein